jgi:hypothetical protein
LWSAVVVFGTGLGAGAEAAVRVTEVDIVIALTCLRNVRRSLISAILSSDRWV